MVTKEEKVTDLGSENEETGFSTAYKKEHVFEQTRARITQQSEKLKDGETLINIKRSDLALHTKNTFLEFFNNVIRAMFTPQDETIKKEWFKDPGSETIQELLVFYFYRCILTTFYLIYSICALYQYTINRLKVYFLSLAYKCNDDPSVISADVNKLPKIPRHLAVILNYKSEQEEGGGLEGLCNDGASIAAWCVSSGIPSLTIYEVNGILNKSVPELTKAIFKKFESYFGSESVPNFLIKVPHLNLSYSGIDGVLVDNSSQPQPVEYDIEVSLLSRVDGRSTIVEMTKVMAQMVKAGELDKRHVKMKFLDHELKQLIGEEPDLIILFQPYLDLQGYPPWHIRLSEMYWEPDNENVSYIVFLRALQKFSTCKVNVGK
ncbi:uncharacterized protein C5L36_0D05570 [Pichia kudriavzevii]|uniref:ditrans,polycis-polyprenyl diphosphate synthase [(2E,6E)-farnesyldiphosphate specific] n=1 Tax=Pichia kudriavzevii TaxID=4909 RepID=A0A2U9R9L5_PICKU|nr:uncharacterized protein C5L36_0D05570 [Pichia kudriavzevii]AWU77831.1 hypothetical protein C5L36_0D05570 [Pichia kudriavzevii]